MGFNMISQIPKIREYLRSQGFEKDIPWDEMINALIILFGIRKQNKAEDWIFTFNRVGKITIEDKIINFKG
jgi:hypothetical protein